MAKKITIYDIARESGVSATTVYKALHNKKGVGDARREEILRLADTLHYTTNTAAQSLSRKEIKIGIVAEVFNQEFGSNILAGIKFSLEKLKERRVTAYFGKLENSLNKARVLQDFKDMLDADIDAIILFPTVSYKEYGQFNNIIREKHIPVVTVNNNVPSLDCLCSVQYDGYLLGQMAGDLIGMCNPGSSNALFIGSKDVFTQNECLRGFSHSLESHGCELSISYEIQVENRVGYLLMNNLMTNYPYVNGLFVGVSQCLGVIQKIKEKNESSKYRLFTVDIYPEVMKNLKDGTITATFDRHSFVMGQLAVNIIYNYLISSTQPMKTIFVPPTMVLPSNAENYSDFLKLILSQTL